MEKCVAINDGKLIVSNFETEDDEIVSYFSEISPELLNERFQTSLKVGAVSLRTLGTTEKIDYIQKEFGKLKHDFAESLKETSSELSDQLEKTFGENGSFSKLIDETFGENGILVKQIFDPNTKGTPLCNLKEGFEDKITKLREDLKIDEAVEEVKAATPLKGYEFEDYCEDILSEIVKKHIGDELKNTSKEDGRITGSKKGDFVITLGERPDCKIVLEMKDKGKLTLPEIHKTMQESIQNRDAKYGIFVTKWVESLPKGVGCFNEYSKENYIVCALTNEKHEGIVHDELLHTAVCWARIRSLLEVAEAEGIDISLLQLEIGDVLKTLELFKRIKAECTNIENNSKKIKDLSDEIRESINKAISAIREELVRVMGEESSSETEIVEIEE